MAVRVSYPGVYIEEFAPGPPIQGVGTSTAAFIGMVAKGELNIPTKVTSWDQFLATFGEQPLSGFFLWYAVRGFFENGGQVCYVVRASNGKYGDGAALLLGGNASSGPRRVSPEPDHACSGPGDWENLLPAATTKLFQPTGNLARSPTAENSSWRRREAAQFKPGDCITIGVAGERVQILRGTDDTLRLTSDLTAAPRGGRVRLADAPAGTRTVRIQPTRHVPPRQIPWFRARF